MTRATQIIPQNPVVYSRDGEVFANSFDVAGYFKKEHRTIFQAAERLISSDPECGAHLRRTSIDLTMPNGGIRQIAGFEMTQSGFTLVAMGLTGQKAVAFKLRYVAEFERMRDELRTPAAPAFDPNDPAVLRQTLIGYTERVIALTATVEAQKAEIAVAAPKARFYDDFADSQGLIILTDLGRVLGVGPIVLIRHLVEKGVLFRTSKGAPLRASSDYLRRGWFETKSTIVGDATRVQTYATPRGLQGIAEMLGRPVDLFGRTTLSRSLPMTQH